MVHAQSCTHRRPDYTKGRFGSFNLQITTCEISDLRPQQVASHVGGEWGLKLFRHHPNYDKRVKSVRLTHSIEKTNFRDYIIIIVHLQHQQFSTCYKPSTVCN